MAALGGGKDTVEEEACDRDRDREDRDPGLRHRAERRAFSKDRSRLRRLSGLHHRRLAPLAPLPAGSPATFRFNPAFTGGGAAPEVGSDIDRRGTEPGAPGGSGAPPGGGGAERTDTGGMEAVFRFGDGGGGISRAPGGGGGGSLEPNDGGSGGSEFGLAKSGGGGGASGSGSNDVGGGGAAGAALGRSLMTGKSDTASLDLGEGGGGGAIKGSSAPFSPPSSLRRGLRRSRAVASPGSPPGGGGGGGGGGGASPPDGGRGFNRSGCGSSLIGGQVNDLTRKHETKKIHSRSHPPPPKLPRLPMKRLVPFTLAAVLLASSACHMFSSKKNPCRPEGEQDGGRRR